MGGKAGHRSREADSETLTTKACKTGHGMLKFKLLRTNAEVLSLGLGFQHRSQAWRPSLPHLTPRKAPWNVNSYTEPS